MLAAQNPITLSFLDSQLEREFLTYYHRLVIRQARIALILGSVLYALFAILDRWIAPEQLQQLTIIRFAVVIPWLLAVFGISFRPSFERQYQAWMASAALVGGLGVTAIVGVTEGQTSMWFTISLILVIVWSFGLSGLNFFNATRISIVLIVVTNIVSIWIAHHPLLILINTNFNILAILIIGMFAGYTIEWYTRRDFLNMRMIEAERLANERLLLNVLPEAIAQRLKQRPETIADRFEQIPILFADIVGFTPLSSQLNPIQLVELLNTLFSAFDGLTDRHELEKIKTIGDAYMVVGGLPHPHPDAIGAIADLALAMQTEVQRLAQQHNVNLSLRIGIHIGTVVAGVIGKKKFTYDIWGDAVNTASRMESHGQPNQIQITETTAQLLRDRYECQRRGEIEIKGKGKMTTYWLQGRYEELHD